MHAARDHEAPIRAALFAGAGSLALALWPGTPLRAQPTQAALPPYEQAAPEGAGIDGTPKPTLPPTIGDDAAPPADPDTVRGIARPDDPESAWLEVPRALLAPPRLALHAVALPLVLASQLDGEYQLAERAEDIFYNDDHTFAAHPTLLLESQLRPNVGARLVDHDLLGARERLELEARYGSLREHSFEADLTSGHRFRGGRLAFALALERSDRHRFYGYGNEALATPARVDRTLDPRDPGLAVRTRFDSSRLRVQVGGATDLASELTLHGSGQLLRRRLHAGATPDLDLPWVTAVYDASALPGFDEPQHDLVGQLGLRLDTRESRRGDMPDSVPATGHRIDAWVDAFGPFEPARVASGRVGLDVQRFFDLYRGNRILRLRLRAVALLGELDDVLLTDVPSLGGWLLLRGYPTDRFRDRVTTLASVEYRYPIQEGFMAYLFVDAGRPHAGLDALSLDRPRVGFGGGISVYSSRDTLFFLQLASSIDGGFELHLRMNSADDLRTQS